MSKKKPLVVVTRKLPAVVETRMRELFDARLNLDDTPMSQAALVEAMKTADVLVPTVTDKIDAGLIAQAGEQLRLIANFGNGVDNIDVASAVQRGITVTNTPGVLTDDTADMTMALILAVARRIAEGARIITDDEWAGWSPNWMLGRRITGKRLGIVGMGRIGQALARRAAAFGLSIHYHNRRRLDSRDRGGARRDLLGFARPDAGAHGRRLGQLPAYPSDLSPALGPPAQADEARRHPGEHGPRRDRSTNRRCRACWKRASSPAPASTCSSTSRRSIRACSSSPASTVSSCCPIWARPPMKAAPTWARRSSSTSKPSWMGTSRRTASCPACSETSTEAAA
jgi:hypothetical protein